MFGGSGLSRYARDLAVAKSKLYKVETIRRNWELLPLIFSQVLVMIAIPFVTYQRLFVTTIDVQLTDYQRFEIPSVPRFFDLRNPRSLKLMNLTMEWRPAIHLDNRYRLMRHEPMLDEDGKETDVIGVD